MTSTDGLPAVSAEDRAFAEKLFANPKVEVLFVGWVKKTKGKESLRRLLIITKYHIVCSKKGITGHSSGSLHHLLDLQQMEACAESQEVKFKFVQNKELCIETAACAEVVQLSLNSYRELSVGFPPHLCVDVTVSGRLVSAGMVPFVDGRARPGGGLASTYEALALRTPKHYSLEVKQWLDATAATGTTAIALNTCPTIVRDKELVLAPLLEGLRYNKWYTSFSLRDLPRAECAPALASMMQTNTTLARLSIAGITLSGEQLGPIATALGENRLTPLSVVDFSCNPVKDTGVKLVAPGLGQLPNLRSLNLSQCQLSSKGFRTLFGVAGLAHLCVLNLSANKLGTAGTEALVAWMLRADQCAGGLQSLILAHSDVDLKVLAHGLSAPFASELRVLDLAGSKGKDTTMNALCEAVSTSGLIDIDFSGSKLPTNQVAMLFRSMATVERHYCMLNLAGSDLGGNSLKLEAALRECVWLDTLVLDNCQLSGEGFGLVCQSLRHCVRLRRMSLSYNLSHKDKHTPAAIKNLVGMLGECAQINAVHLCGNDKHFLGTQLMPVLTALLSSENISELDISGNRVGDDGIFLLAQLLQKSSTLKALACDGNDMTYEGLKFLSPAVKNNLYLTFFPLPLCDIKKIRPGMSPIHIRSLMNMLKTMKTNIIENERLVSSILDPTSIQELDRGRMLLGNRMALALLDQPGVADLYGCKHVQRIARLTPAAAVLAAEREERNARLERADKEAAERLEQERRETAEREAADVARSPSSAGAVGSPVRSPLARRSMSVTSPHSPDGPRGLAAAAAAMPSSPSTSTSTAFPMAAAQAGPGSNSTSDSDSDEDDNWDAVLLAVNSPPQKLPSGQKPALPQRAAAPVDMGLGPRTNSLPSIARRNQAPPRASVITTMDEVAELDEMLSSIGMEPSHTSVGYEAYTAAIMAVDLGDLLDEGLDVDIGGNVRRRAMSAATPQATEEADAIIANELAPALLNVPDAPARTPPSRSSSFTMQTTGGTVTSVTTSEELSPRLASTPMANQLVDGSTPESPVLTDG